jgi:hypothetical protein
MPKAPASQLPTTGPTIHPAVNDILIVEMTFVSDSVGLRESSSLAAA